MQSINLKELTNLRILYRKAKQIYYCYFRDHTSIQKILSFFQSFIIIFSSLLIHIRIAIIIDKETLLKTSTSIISTYIGSIRIRIQLAI